MEALYNLGLVCNKLDHLDQALVAFKKLNNILPENIEVLYQVSTADPAARRQFQVLAIKLGPLPGWSGEAQWPNFQAYRSAITQTHCMHIVVEQLFVSIATLRRSSPTMILT